MLELDTLAGDAVDVRGLVAHQAVRVGANIRNADVIAPDDEDIGFVSGRSGRRSRSRCLLRLRQRAGSQRGGCHQGGGAEQHVTAAKGGVIRLFFRSLFFSVAGHFRLLLHYED
jgi:hypothetical protein